MNDHIETISICNNEKEMLKKKLDALTEDKKEVEKTTFKFSFELNRIFRRAMRESTSHGIPKLFSPDLVPLIKVCWFIAILVSSAGCGYFLYDAISKYLTFKVVTSIKVINENPALFPTVRLLK